MVAHFGGKDDNIGHSFVILESPDGTRIARGFYPLNPINDTVEQIKFVGSAEVCMIIRTTKMLLIFTFLNYLSVKVVADSSEVRINIKKFLDHLGREIYTSWTIKDNGEYVSLLSPASQIDSNYKYCSQIVIKLKKDKHGDINSLHDQIMLGDLHFMYSINSKDRICSEIDNAEFFYVDSLNFGGPDIGLMKLMESLSSKPWLHDTSSKYFIEYKNEDARACLNNKDELKILSAVELPLKFNDSEAVYKINFGGCKLKGREFFIEIFVKDILDDRNLSLVATAIDKKELECIKTECYGEIYSK